MNKKHIEILKSEQELIDELMTKESSSSQTIAKPNGIVVGTSEISISEIKSEFESNKQIETFILQNEKDTIYRGRNKKD